MTANLLRHDPYLVLADFSSYLEAQQAVSDTWRDPERWTRMSVMNVCRIGYFSSDRAIHEYAERIWRVRPTSIRRPYAPDAARGAGRRARTTSVGLGIADAETVRQPVQRQVEPVSLETLPLLLSRTIAVADRDSISSNGTRK